MTKGRKLDDTATIIVLGSPECDESDYEDLCDRLFDFTAKSRFYGDYIKYRIIQSGEPTGMAAMARKFAKVHEHLRAGEQHKDYLIKDWLTDKQRCHVDLCIAYMMGDESDEPTWQLLKQIVALGINDIRIV